jgi:soluble lytic murein transglycosylase-like protein
MISGAPAARTAGRSATRRLHPPNQPDGPGRARFRQRWVVAAATVAVTLGVLAGCGGSPRRIPANLIPLFQAAADQYGPLSAAQLAAQARVESKFDNQAVSHSGARGIMQFLPSTWSQFGVDGNHDGKADPMDPADAIPAAARYDEHLADRLRSVPGDHISLVLAAYNAGLSAVIAADGVPNIRETRTYVARVLSWADRFNDQV